MDIQALAKNDVTMDAYDVEYFFSWIEPPHPSKAIATRKTTVKYR
jgi:hypothetical protein